MMSRIDPALDRRIYFFVFTGTVNGFVKADDLLFQSRNGGDRLKCGTRRFLGLGRVVVKRQGQVFLKLFHICRISTSGQTVVVIAWVGNQRPHLSGIDICNDHAARTRIQCQLRRCQFDVLNFAPYKLECVFLTIGC